jgi:hypothetical protein
VVPPKKKIDQEKTPRKKVKNLVGWVNLASNSTWYPTHQKIIDQEKKP